MFALLCIADELSALEIMTYSAMNVNEITDLAVGLGVRVHLTKLGLARQGAKYINAKGFVTEPDSGKPGDDPVHSAKLMQMGWVLLDGVAVCFFTGGVAGWASSQRQGCLGGDLVCQSRYE